MKPLHIIFSLILLSGCVDPEYVNQIKRRVEELERKEAIRENSEIPPYGERWKQQQLIQNFTQLLDYRDGQYIDPPYGISIKLCDGKRRYLETQPSYRIEDRREKAEAKK